MHTLGFSSSLPSRSLNATEKSSETQKSNFAIFRTFYDLSCISSEIDENKRIKRRSNVNKGTRVFGHLPFARGNFGECKKPCTFLERERSLS